jgi:hypothetical protein
METSEGRTSSHGNNKKEMEVNRTHYVKIRVQQRGKPWTGIPRVSEGEADEEQPGGQERFGERSRA